MEIVFYTDGGCEPNPGNGTWAFVCLNPYFESSGYEANTTNNRMEMIAVLKAYEYAISIRATCIRINSDSQYVVNGFNEWMHNWKRRKWRDVKNLDLWLRFYDMRNKLTLVWVKGHNGNEYNELTDHLVRLEYERVFGGTMRY